MKKIISILLMLSMAFSLVACSTEPVSDVRDNNNADVSSEVSEEVSDNDTDVTGLSLDELSEHELEFIDILTNTDWQSYGYTEDHENWIENYDVSIDFNEDFTLTYTDENGANEGEWNYDRYEAEYEDYIVKLHINGEEFYCSAGLDNEVYIYIESRERDFAAEFAGVGLVGLGDFTLAETVWELSSITDENGYVDYDVNPLVFEFTSGTEGKLVQPTKEDNVGFTFDATSIIMSASDFYSADHIDTEFEMTSEFFEKYNDENKDIANCEIYDRQLTITTDTFAFKFRYSGTTVNTPLTGNISLDLASIYDFDLPEDYDDATSDSVYIENYSLLLKVDGTAEFSNGSEIITGTWDYVNHLWRGESNFTINLLLDSNLLDFENNSEFFASLSQQVENETRKHNDFEITQDDAGSYTLEIEGYYEATIKSKYNGFTFDYNR